MQLHPTVHRILKRSWSAIGWLMLLVSSVVLLAVSVLVFQPQVVIKVVSRALEPVFQGSIEITDVEFIALDHVEGVDAILRDPEGRVIAELHDMSATLPLYDVLNQLIGGSPALTIDLKRVHARYARVDLATNAEGELRLAEAVTPRPSSKPQSSSQDVIVHLRSIVIERAWIHGAPQPEFPLDVGVSRLTTALGFEGDQLTIGPASLRADARVVGPVRGVGIGFEGKGRLNVEVTEREHPQGAPRVPALLEELDFTATLTQGESRVELSGEQAHQELSLVARGTYVPEEGILAQRSPIDLDVNVQGTLDDLDALVSLEAAGMKSRLDLTSQWDDELVIDGEWTVDNFSPTLIDAQAPASSIDARVAFQARRSPSSRLPSAQEDDPEWAHWSASLDGHFSAFSLAGERIPPLQLTIRLDPPEWHARLETAQGKGRTRLVVQGELDRELPPDHLNVSGRLDLSELRPYLPGLHRGTGTIDVSGRISPAKSEVEAQLDLDVRNVQYKTTISAEKLQVQGRISGNLSNPQLTARAHAEALNVLIGTPQERYFEKVDVRWSGTLASSDLSVVAEQKERTIEARTRIRLTPRLETEQTRVVLRGEGAPVTLTADRIDVDSGGIRISEVKFSGLGEGELSGTVNRSGVALKGHVRNVPLEGIAERFSIDLKGARGDVDLDADFKIGPGTAQGRIRLLLVRGGLRQGPRAARDVPLLDVRLDVIGEGRNLVLVAEVTPNAEPDSAARVHAVVDVVVPEGALFKQPRSWVDRVLTVKTRGTLDLEWIPAALLPEHTDIRGRVDFRAKVERPDEGSVPSASLSVRTSGLHVTLPREGKVEDQDVTLTTIDGVDFKAQVSHLPERGITRAWVGVFQGQRMLGHVRGRVEATLTSLRFPQGLLSYRDAPIEVHAELSRVPLHDLPGGVRVAGARGHLSMSALINGSFTRPELAARAQMQGFYMERSPPPKPLDAELTLDYGAQLASAELRVFEASEGQKKERLFARAKAHFETEISSGTVALERIDASARLRQFPVDSVLLPATAQGSLSGHLEVVQYGTSEPQLDMKLDFGRMSMGGVPLEGGKLRAHADAHSAEVFVEFEGQEFELRADVKTDLVWSSPYVPALGDVATGQVLTRRFPLRILQPLVSSSLADLNGKLDAQFRGRITEGGPVVSGRATLTEGSLQFPRVGQQFRDARAEIEWAESGRVTLKKASFRGVTGRARVKGSARMDGLRPQSAAFQLEVERTERLPLSVQGLGVGEFWGDVRGEVELAWEENRIDTKVDFRRFQVVFPEIVTGGVQSLQPDEHVSAGAWVNEREFVVVPLQPIEKKKGERESWTVQVGVDLGNDFWVQQGPRRRIQIGGKLLVNAEEEVTVEGKLSLSRGRIQLNGRMFEIDEGTVTFQPDDPGNPIIVAEARWQSPEGTVVIARFLGPVESGEMTLTSEPPLPQDQIVSLLLFGDTAGLNGADSGGGNSDSQAAAVGGSVAAQGLNQALSRVEAIDISTRIDTTSSDAVRPEVVIQLTNSVSAQVGYNLEEPSPGESPDRTVVSLEVRLRGGNAVSATLGDRGSAFFDWVWRYRY